MTMTPEQFLAAMPGVNAPLPTPAALPVAGVTETSQTIAAGQLRAFIERVEHLEEEKQTIADDIKDVFAEMKGTGFDTKAVRTIIAMRKKDAAERQEDEAILDLYKAAIGME